MARLILRQELHRWTLFTNEVTIEANRFYLFRGYQGKGG